MESSEQADAPWPRILIVEDEQAIADAIAQRLRGERFEVACANDGLTGVAMCENFRPDLVILDLMLPGIDGLEVCRRIQAERRTPVLMLTARDDEADLLTGLAVGADDYLTKPFSPRELVARVRAVLRRAAPEPESAESQCFTVLSVVVDARTRRVLKDDQAVHLTPLEFDLVVCLASRGGAVMTRDVLLAEVWGYDGEFGARTVDSHVRSVRRKLGDEVIRTVHAVGYAIGGPQ